MLSSTLLLSFFFFFNDTATTEIYTLSLHDALPIYYSSFRVFHRWRHGVADRGAVCAVWANLADRRRGVSGAGDRKSTRLNSSHSQISYAVFCLKKKKRSHELRTPRGRS